jgi:hypothetical protein
MKTLGFVLRELEIVAIVALAAMLAGLFPGAPSVAGSFLLLGCLGTLSLNVASAARRRFGGSP